VTKYDPDAKPDADARSGVGENALGETIVPVEAVVSAADTKKLHRQADFAEQINDERARRSKEPVKMAGLKPLPPELMSKVPGAGVIPGGPEALGLTPTMRRSIPEPYKRHRIDIDHHGKTWAYARADSVAAGDIVVDFGKIEVLDTEVIHEEVNGVWAATSAVLVLTNIMGERRKFDPDEQLQVFRVHD
jgi:hypothetical protein